MPIYDTRLTFSPQANTASQAALMMNEEQEHFESTPPSIWLNRVLEVGGTPRKIQSYLDQVWPIPSIDKLFGVHMDVMLELLERWGLALSS